MAVKKEHCSRCLGNVQPEGTARCTLTRHTVPWYTLSGENSVWDAKPYARRLGIRVLLLPHLCCSGTLRLVLDDRVHAKWTSKNHAALLELSLLLNHAQSEAIQRENSSVCTGEHGSRGCTAVLHMF